MLLISFSVCAVCVLKSGGLRVPMKTEQDYCFTCTMRRSQDTHVSLINGQ